MLIWWAIPIFVALVGVLLLVGGIGRMFKLKFLGGGIRSLFGLLALALAGIAGLIGLNLQTYAQLSKETLAGQVKLKKTGEYAYTATVDIADKGKLRGKPVDYPVTGEIIYVSGPVLTFKPWANVIGMDSIFTLTRVKSEYIEANCQNLYHPKVMDTNEDASKKMGLASFGGLGESWKTFNVVDTLHYSASGQPMTDGAVYDIYATQDAFVMKPNKDSAVANAMQKEIVTAKGAHCEPPAAAVTTPAGPAPGASPSATPAAPAVPSAPAPAVAPPATSTPQ
jgi:hypothetical protein